MYCKQLTSDRPAERRAHLIAISLSFNYDQFSENGGIYRPKQEGGAMRVVAAMP
jgi:hypothetical protein